MSSREKRWEGGVRSASELPSSARLSDQHRDADRSARDEETEDLYDLQEQETERAACEARHLDRASISSAAMTPHVAKLLPGVTQPFYCQCSVTHEANLRKCETSMLNSNVLGRRSAVQYKLYTNLCSVNLCSQPDKVRSRRYRCRRGEDSG